LAAEVLVPATHARAVKAIMENMLSTKHWGGKQGGGGGKERLYFSSILQILETQEQLPK